MLTMNKNQIWRSCVCPVCEISSVQVLLAWQLAQTLNNLGSLWGSVSHKHKMCFYGFWKIFLLRNATPSHIWCDCFSLSTYLSSRTHIYYNFCKEVSSFSPHLFCCVFLQHVYTQPTAVMQCLYNRTLPSSVRGIDITGNFIWASLKSR